MKLTILISLERSNIAGARIYRNPWRRQLGSWSHYFVS